MADDIPNATKHGALRALGLIAAVVWIAGGTLFFLIRFSSAFYLANKEAINAWVSRLLR